MARFLKLLDALERDDPSYAQAVQNVRDDVASETNQHGNLSPQTVEKIESDCASKGDARGAIERHTFLQQPDLHRQCDSVPAPGTIRRAMAPTTFVAYHLFEGTAADQALVEDVAKNLARGTRTHTAAELGGSTGPNGRPCWWTFDEPDHTRPAEGEAYMHELALGLTAIRQAQLDEAVVEVELPVESLAVPLVKPTSLEGFGADTNFRPELTGADHGRTWPTRVGLCAWPEVVSKSVSYGDLDEELDIKIDVFGFGS